LKAHSLQVRRIIYYKKYARRIIEGQNAAQPFHRRQEFRIIRKLKLKALFAAPE